jgi:hypothetical protein
MPAVSRGRRLSGRDREVESQPLLTAGTIRRLRIPIAKPVRTPTPLMNMSRTSNSLPSTIFRPHSKATPSSIVDEGGWDRERAEFDGQ